MHPSPQAPSRRYIKAVDQEPFLEYSIIVPRIFQKLLFLRPLLRLHCLANGYHVTHSDFR